MMKSVYSLNFNEVPLPYFLTLTYHDEWAADPAKWKDQLEALVKRLERIWGPLTYYWRLEFQRRGAPHFHLLLWLQDPERHIPNARERLVRLRNNVAWCWNEIVDPSDHEHLEAGTDVSSCRNLRQLSGYLSKYVAKPEQYLDPSAAGIGRVWGCWRGDWLPRLAICIALTPDQWLRVRRVLAGYTGQRIFSPRPRGGEVFWNGMSAFLSSNTAKRLLEWLGAGSRPPPDTGDGASRARMSTKAPEPLEADALVGLLPSLAAEGG